MIHLALQQLTNNPTPLVWVLEHLSAVGWPAIVYFAWKVGGYFRQTSEQVSKTITQIDTLATNHMPHMEASLRNQDELLHSMDGSLKTIANNSSRRRENF